MLAVNVVGVVGAVSPITQAIYPHMVDLDTRDDRPALASAYHQGAQLVVTVLTAPAAMLLNVRRGRGLHVVGKCPP